MKRNSWIHPVQGHDSSTGMCCEPKLTRRGRDTCQPELYVHRGKEDVFSLTMDIFQTFVHTGQPALAARKILLISVW